MEERKKGFRVPNTYTLIMAFVILATIMTYIVPAGEFQTVKDAVTGRNLVDPTSFHFVERHPVGVMDFLLSIVNGMNKSATMIFLVFLIGGFFEVITSTGALDAAIGTSVRKLDKKALLVIPVVMFIFTVMGALGIIVNASIAFIPLGVILARKLKLDPIVGAAMIYLGAFSGATSTPMGFYNTILGQTIAGLPILSGFGFRTVVWMTVFGVTLWYVMRYARKVRGHEEASVLDSDEIVWPDDDLVDQDQVFTLRHGIIFCVLLGGFALYTYGSFHWKWPITYLTAIMLGVALISGFIGGLHPDEMAKSFVNGCKAMVYGALVIGFAKAISIVLTDGRIIHTVIYYLSLPLASVGSTMAAVLMFFINLIFNFFVPSGSGQAMIVMPLLAPMADIVGVSRQIAVSAYLYGDGFSNTIIPTSGVLMGVLGVANIPYGKWLKFMLPLFGLWVLIGTLSLVLASMIGWS